MARSFDVSTVNRASVEEVRSALGSEQYWLDRLEAYGGNGRSRWIHWSSTPMEASRWRPPRICAAGAARSRFPMPCRRG